MADYGTANAISLSQGRNLSHTSDDDGSSDHSPRSVPTSGGGGVSSSSKPSSKIMSLSGEILISKKPRGRPPGSKNKPKPPIIITKDSDSAMKPVVLEIAAGSDVLDTVLHYARSRHVGITVLSGSGTVSSVTLRHPAGSHAPSLSLHGPFNLLSLSGSFMDSLPSLPAFATTSFGICLAGAQGHVFGGIVGGKVVAAGVVVVVAATFLSPTVVRLPLTSYDRESGGPGGDNAEHLEAEETKPCINSESNCGGYCSGGGGVPSPTPVSCQIMSPEHAMPWGAPPPPSRPHPY